MIVLDTNIVSAMMRPDSVPAVLTWLDTQPTESIWTTTVTLFEIRFGLAVLPPGKRRTALELTSSGSSRKAWNTVCSTSMPRPRW